MQNQVTRTTTQPTITNFLNSPSFKKQLMAVLPKHLTPERLVRIAMTEIRMNPKLAECDPMAFAGAIMRCAQIGLEPSSEKQHVHLIPFKNNKEQRMECQVIVGYRGLLALAVKSNTYIESDVVYTNDLFEFEKGMNPKCKFMPCTTGHRGEVLGAYAMARICLPDSSIIFVHEFMPKSDIDKIMITAKGYNYPDSPWKKHYDSMARKTAIRKLFKYIPTSDEIDSALNADDLAERDAQDNASLLVNDTDIVNETKPQEPSVSKAEALATLLSENPIKE